jgi:catechol 2,3-dioxygenase-like lactoylglutathione lyase family enzyme
MRTSYPFPIHGRGMPFQVRFVYSGIRVRDLVRSVAFYRRIGFRVIKKGWFSHGGQVGAPHLSGVAASDRTELVPQGKPILRAVPVRYRVRPLRLLRLGYPAVASIGAPGGGQAGGGFCGRTGPPGVRPGPGRDLARRVRAFDPGEPAPSSPPAANTTEGPPSRSSGYDAPDGPPQKAERCLRPTRIGDPCYPRLRPEMGDTGRPTPLRSGLDAGGSRS